MAVGALESARDLASDLGAMLSALMVLALLVAFETTDRLESSSRAIVGPLTADAAEDMLGRYTASMLLPSKSMTAALKYPDCESRILGSPCILAPAFRALMKNEPTASFDGAGKATCTAPGGDLLGSVSLVCSMGNISLTRLTQALSQSSRNQQAPPASDRTLYSRHAAR